MGSKGGGAAPGFEPRTSCLRVRSLNHYATGAVPRRIFIVLKCFEQGNLRWLFSTKKAATTPYIRYIRYVKIIRFSVFLTGGRVEGGEQPVAQVQCHVQQLARVPGHPRHPGGGAVADQLGKDVGRKEAAGIFF